MFFSDGAASQFKQKYLFVNLHLMQVQHKLERFAWHFFATSHGKGAVDGVGGTVKRLVWRRVLAEKVIVSDAASFFNCAVSANTGICVLFVSANDVELNRAALNERWSCVTGIPGTHSIHSVVAVNDTTVMHKPYSLSNTCTYFDMKLGEECHNSDGGVVVSPANDDAVQRFAPGQFVVVMLPGKGRTVQKFVCEIVTVDHDDNEMEVVYLKSQGETGRVFVGSNEKPFWVSLSQVMSCLPLPSVNRRGHYTFPCSVEPWKVQ